MIPHLFLTPHFAPPRLVSVFNGEDELLIKTRTHKRGALPAATPSPVRSSVVPPAESPCSAREAAPQDSAAPTRPLAAADGPGVHAGARATPDSQEAS